MGIWGSSGKSGREPGLLLWSSACFWGQQQASGKLSVHVAHWLLLAAVVVAIIGIFRTSIDWRLKFGAGFAGSNDRIPFVLHGCNLRRNRRLLIILPGIRPSNRSPGTSVPLRGAAGNHPPVKFGNTAYSEKDRVPLNLLFKDTAVFTPEVKEKITKSFEDAVAYLSQVGINSNMEFPTIGFEPQFTECGSMVASGIPSYRLTIGLGPWAPTA